MKRKPVPQEHPMGCGVACVAFVLGETYQKALKRFKNKRYAAGRGFYARDMAAALSTSGDIYTFKYVRGGRDPLLRQPGVIAYAIRSKAYPLGHYLARGRMGWMNPWKNNPQMIPVMAAFQKRLPARATYVIYPARLRGRCDI